MSGDTREQARGAGSPAARQGGAAIAAPPATLRQALTNPITFSHTTLPGRELRRYQQPPIEAIARSVINGEGKAFAVVFSRQAGKDESLSQLIVWILSYFRRKGGTIIIALPTLEQAQITLGRIHELALISPLTKRVVRRRDNTVSVGSAMVKILSAEPTANVRGNTANLLLVANEAQDIDTGRWDSAFAPMAASTNATTVFMGTVWDNEKLLTREMKHLAAIETAADRRLFLVPWRLVGAENPAYQRYVEGQIEKLGENHPYIQTEYELVPMESNGRLFTEARLAQLQGSHERLSRASKLAQYAMLIDVAGEEEGDPSIEAFDTASKRDSTTATIIELVFVDRFDRPMYRVVDRRMWTGARHTTLHRQLHDLAVNVWRITHLVIDATGVGTGLASMLTASLLKERITVVPVIWTSKLKSTTAWDLIGMIETGRLKDYAIDRDPLTREFWEQMRKVRYELLPGPGQRVKWSVPTSQGHDDLVMSLALITTLDDPDQVRLQKRIARGNSSQ